MARSRLHRRYNGSETRPNPPLFTDLMEFVVPGFVGFATTRFATYIAATQIAKRKPSLGKHVGVGVSIGAFLAAWFLAHRLKGVAKYHTPIVVGSAIAALQSILQLYFPKIGWMVGDATPEIAAAHEEAQQIAEHADLEPVEIDPNEFTYNDSYDAGRYSAPPSSKVGKMPKPTPSASKDDDLSDLEIDDAIGSQNLGVFSN